MAVTARIVDLGRMAFSPTTDIQRQTLEQVALGAVPNTLFFVEHDPVLTLGASFHEENLLLSRSEYKDLGIEIAPTDRGGDVTYHGPRQLVIYPVFDVSQFGRDLHRWLRDLEEVIILTLQEYGLQGYRAPEINTGVWVNGRKIAALGIKVRKWVSMHGIALNCNNDLAPFSTIVPCGIRDHGVTSLTQEAGRDITAAEVKPAIQGSFERVFNVQFTA